MKRNHAAKLTVIALSFLVLLVVATNSVVASPNEVGECGPICHASTGTITLSTNSTVDAETNVTFTLQISAVGDVDYIAIKGEWDENIYFDFEEVTVQDQSGDDTNAVDGEISTEVSFTPLTNGTYTLRIFAVTDSGPPHLSTSFDVTVTVTGDPGVVPPPPVDLYGIWTSMMIWVPAATAVILLLLGYLALKRD